MKGRRLLAVLTASILGAAAVCGSAQAATFRDVEYASLEEAKQKILETPQEEKATGARAGINLKLEDAGRAIAGMLLPVDVSWLDNAEIAVESSMGEEQMNAVLTASLNGTKILTMNIQMDLNTMEMVIQAPEISDALLKANYTDLMKGTLETTAGEETSETSLTAEDYSNLYRIGINLQKNPPSPETIVSLMDRYCSIVFDAYEEGEAGTETVSIDGYSVEASVAEGILTQERTMDMAVTLLNTAREDEELKGVLEQALAGTSEEGTAYQTFQATIDSALEEIAKSEETAEEGEDAEGEPESISLKLYLDDQENKIGVQVTGADDENQDLFMRMLYPSGEDWSALDVELVADEDQLCLTGSGQKADGKLNGTYKLLVDNKEMVDIQAVQNTDAKETGVFDGEYVLTPVTDAEDSSNPMNSFAGFGLAAAIHTDKTSGNVKLDLQSSGASLLSMTLSAEKSADEVVIDLPETAEVYDMTDDEAMNGYLSSINPMAVISNLFEAGMPEEVLTQLMGGDSGEEGDIEAGDDYAEEEPAA